MVDFYQLMGQYGIEPNHLIFGAIAVILIFSSIFLILSLRRGKKGKSEINEEKDESIKLMSLNEELKKQNKEFGDRVNQLTIEKGEIGGQYEEEIEKLKNEKEALEVEISKVTSLKEEINFLRSKIGEMEDQNKMENQDREKSIIDLKKSYEEKMQSTHTESDGKVNKILKEAEEGKIKYEEKISGLQLKIEELEAENENTYSKIQEEFELKLKEKQNEVLLAKEKHRGEIQEIVSKTDKEKGDLVKKLQDEKAQMDENYKQRIIEIKEKTKESIQRITEDKENLIEELRNELILMKKENEKIKEKLHIMEIEKL